MKYISKGIVTLKWINEIKDPTHWQKLHNKHLLGYSNSTPQNHDHVKMSKTSPKIVGKYTQKHLMLKNGRKNNTGSALQERPEISKTI